MEESLNAKASRKGKEKAVRWAIFSAQKSMSPTLTAFMLPMTDENAYQKWLTHPDMREHRCIVQDHTISRGPYKHHSKDDTAICVVPNQAGLDKFLHLQRRNSLRTSETSQQDTDLMGAGVYGWKDGAEVNIRIRPSRTGPVPTINRAELIALRQAVCQWQGRDDLVITTDPAFAMQGIYGHLQSPEAHEYNKRLPSHHTAAAHTRAKTAIYLDRQSIVKA